MLAVFFGIIVVAAPVTAAIMEHVGNAGISERRHSHHDTYVTPAALTRSLIVDMAFVSAIAVVLGWLCYINVFTPNPDIVMAFFASFSVVMFLAWYILSRYKVSLFEDEMVMVPFFGHEVTVNYQDINRMEWVGGRRGSGFRDLLIWTSNASKVRLSGMIGLDQVLLKIDRFDVLAHSSNM
jgi:hypothetical protein